MNIYPIVIVDDDEDEISVIADAFSEIGLKNECHCFASPFSALDYLYKAKVDPLIIICDMKMHGLSGIDFRNVLCETAFFSKKNIPFVFLSGFADTFSAEMKQALQSQGVFQKPDTIAEYDIIARKIIDIAIAHKFFSATANGNSQEMNKPIL